jgi:hypothetical protein
MTEIRHLSQRGKPPSNLGRRLGFARQTIGAIYRE